ncbi:glycosyltransferase family A protein [Leuconostocaceae bacterium ESL0723]|nr:glycosyltransferase family A protein [Leuconostocaceae bacterium ESL0723]
MVTVLTVTYNRGHLLERLFNSLCQQTQTDFQWLVIDDGSTDDTAQRMAAFQAKKPPFRIDYHVKENGGKHTGLNYAHPFIQGQVTVIVDSDDYLVENGIAQIEAAWQPYLDDPKLATVTFEQADDQGHLLGHFPRARYLGSELDYRYAHHIGGDFAETIRTEVLKAWPLPEFQGERFFPEGWLWQTIARHYDTLDLQGVLVVGGYQAGGLTQQGRQQRLKAPRGMVTYYQALTGSVFPLSTRLKSALAAQVYQHFVPKNLRTKLAVAAWLRWLTALPADFLAWRWRKYGNQQ